MIELVLRGGGGQHHLPAGLLHADQQLTRPGESLDPIQIAALERLSMSGLQPLALGLVGVGQQGRDQHVGALADLVVDRLVVKARALGAEGFGPGADMQVVAVDQSAVDIEQDRLQRHCRPSCPSPRPLQCLCSGRRPGSFHPGGRPMVRPAFRQGRVRGRRRPRRDH